MAQTIVGLYRNAERATEASRAVIAAGVSGRSLQVIQGEQAAFPPLIAAGVPNDDARLYEQAVRRGAVVLLVTVEDQMADRVEGLIDSHGAESPEDILATLPGRPGPQAVPQAGPQAVPPAGPQPVPQPVAQPMRTPQQAAAPPQPAPYQPVAAPAEPQAPSPRQPGQDISVRQREDGGVLVRTGVTEQRVEENITLAEERIDVERRPADREATEADLINLSEAIYEFVESVEELVIVKRPRVVEEIVVRKEAQDRREVVTEVLRKTKVSVERFG